MPLAMVFPLFVILWNVLVVPEFYEKFGSILSNFIDLCVREYLSQRDTGTKKGGRNLIHPPFVKH